MIWFFLAGFIAGAAGTVMYAHHWIVRHTTKVLMTKDEWDALGKKQEERSDD